MYETSRYLKLQLKIYSALNNYNRWQFSPIGFSGRKNKIEEIASAHFTETKIL